MALGVLWGAGGVGDRGLQLRGTRVISSKFPRFASPGKLALRLLHGKGCHSGMGGVTWAARDAECAPQKCANFK